MTAVPISTITESARHRTDMGDIKSLAESMTEVGQLQPVVVTADMNLVAGARRLAAARSLGWTEVEAHVVTNLSDAASMLRAESDENTQRKPFTPTEAEAIAAAREALLKPLREVDRREKIASARKSDGAKLAPSQSEPKSRAAAAAGTGYSAETIRKVREVKSIAAAPTTPEPVREAAKTALASMDAEGKVDGAHKAVKQALSVAELEAKFPELSYYREQGNESKLVEVGRALTGYAEPELSLRREALRRHIAAEQRRNEEPQPEPAGPDYLHLADRMFEAVNAAAKEIKRSGGAETLAHVAHEDPLMVGNWRDQYEQLAATCAALADALKPSLRRVK